MCDISKNTKFAPKEFKDDHLYVFNKECHFVKKINTSIGTIGKQEFCTIL